jgi:hypothetical protein
MQHRTKQSIVRRILKIEARTKALYKTKEDLTSRLIGVVPIGEPIPVDGREFALVDNFAARNQVWSGACVRRFELGEVKPAPRAKKAGAEAQAPTPELALEAVPA